MEQESVKIQAIDVLNYPFTTEALAHLYDNWDFKYVSEAVFKQPLKMDPDLLEANTPEKFVALMDKSGYEKVFISAPKMFSFRKKTLLWNFHVDQVYEMIKDYPGRLVGIAGYDPYHIEDSLKEVDHAIKDLNFKGVYAHVYGFDLPINDRTMYPLYAKCNELGVPVSLQTGHSLENMPTEHGRPLLIDRVALDFPNLRLIISHTGWPWVEEAIAMAWKHEHVYLDISAHFPMYLDPSIVRFMDTRGRDKTLFGTNGMGLKRFTDQFAELEVRDKTRQKVLRENAIKVFNL
ncbi:amidohydrolase family protein [Chloroflexota bacterium]